MIWNLKLLLTVALVSAYSPHGWAETEARVQRNAFVTDTKGQCPSPPDLKSALSRASSALARAQFQVAIETLKGLADQDCEARINLLLAAAYEENDELPRAEQTLERAHSAWPADTSIATSLAREYMVQGRPEEAAKALDHFQATAATPWQEIQLSVVTLLATHRLASAETLAQFGFKTYPSLDSLLLLANSLQLEGRYKDVIALLEGKRSTYSRSAKFLVTLAESEFDASIYDNARSDLERAITLDRTLYQAHYLLGNILMKQGQAENAATEYRTALELAPDHPRTYYHLALAFRAMHEEEQEEGVLSKAVALDPNYALAHCELGRLLLNKGRAADAVTELEFAVAENSSLEEAYSLLSRAYERLGDKAKAQEMAQRLSVVRSANHGGSQVQREGEGVSSAP